MASPTNDIVIYEPLYAAGQTQVQPLFAPLHLPDDARPSWREFWIYVHMFRRGLHRQARYTGLLSPRFGEKTHLAGNEVVDFVAAHSEADICLFSPMPQLPYVTLNVWQHGEDNHPGLVVAAQALLDATELGWPLREEGRHGPAISCYANYWVGNERFWNRYVGGLLLPLAEYLEREPDMAVAGMVLEPTDYEVTAPFLPFVVERLVTTFLAHSPDIAVAAWQGDPVAAAYHGLQHEIVLAMRERIDAADQLPVFPDDIAELLGLFSRLNSIYEASYFSLAPRPLSGRIVPLRRSNRGASEETS